MAFRLANHLYVGIMNTLLAPVGYGYCYGRNGGNRLCYQDVWHTLSFLKALDVNGISHKRIGCCAETISFQKIIFWSFVQSTFCWFTVVCRDVNNDVMEMLIMAYAFKTSSARRIIGVVPYLPYSKQSKMRRRGCIASKLVAQMMSLSGKDERRGVASLMLLLNISEL